MLFFPFTGPGYAVKASLHGNEDGRKECAIAVEDARHVTAERFHEQNDDPAEDEYLYPTVESHGVAFRALAECCRTLLRIRPNATAAAVFESRSAENHCRRPSGWIGKGFLEALRTNEGVGEVGE